MRCDEQNFYDSRRSCSGTGCFQAPSEYLNYYPGYNTITQNSAGDIVFNCSDGYVDIYIEKESYSYDTDFLENKSKSDCSYGHYLGSFKTKNA